MKLLWSLVFCLYGSLLYAEEFVPDSLKRSIAEALQTSIQSLEFADYMVMETNSYITVVKHNGTCSDQKCFYFGFARDENNARLVFYERAMFIKFRKYNERGIPTFLSSNGTDLIFKGDRYEHFTRDRSDALFPDNDLYLFYLFGDKIFCEETNMCFGKKLTQSEYTQLESYIDYYINYSLNGIFVQLNVLSGGGFSLKVDDENLFYIKKISPVVAFEALTPQQIERISFISTYQ